MRNKIILVLALLIGIGWLAFGSAEQPQVKHETAPVVASNDGAELYAAYCASCHGVEGRGDGVAAPNIGLAVPDLTRIAERDGKFDYWTAYNKIAGADRAAYHAEMPAWSSVLFATYSSHDRERIVIHNLVRQLEQMQVASGETPPLRIAGTKILLAPIPRLTHFDGPAVYAAYCADCHGADGRGDGRLTARLPAEVPDLTRLAATAEGFDHARIQSAIAGRHMVPSADAEPWFDVFTASYGTGRGQLILENLTRHVEQMQVRDAVPPGGLNDGAALLRRPISPVSRMDGKTLYAAYCADCHGADGRGDGRLSERLSFPVPDLTRLADEQGKVDIDELRTTIATRQMVPVAGAEPWFDVLEASYGFNRTNVALNELARHVGGMQRSN